MSYTFEASNYIKKKKNSTGNSAASFFHGTLIIVSLYITCIFIYNIYNVEITLIDKTDPSDPGRREEFWKTKLRTLAPLGLNIEE